MGYRYSPRRHSRYIRYNERLKRWEWCLFSATCGRCLEVLMHGKDLRALECMIEGWKKSESESRSQTV